MSTETTATLPATGRDTRPLVSRLVPLWRYGVFFAAVFGLVATGTGIRLDAQQLREDLERTSDQILASGDVNDGLKLELESRRRRSDLEKRATAMGWGPDALIVRLEAK